MKKIILVAFVLLFSISIHSQKKKVKSLKTNNIVLAKTDQLSAEINKNNFFLQLNNKDTIYLKTVDLKNVPTDCKIIPFKTNEINLYLITWIEKSSIKTNLKTEDIVDVYSRIYDIDLKKLIFSNIQITTNTTEIVFLDKLKNASETQQRIKREGFQFTLTPIGDILLKNKTQENRLSYNAIDKKYVDAKPAKTPVSTKTVVNKKKR